MKKRYTFTTELSVARERLVFWHSRYNDARQSLQDAGRLSPGDHRAEMTRLVMRRLNRARGQLMLWANTTRHLLENTSRASS